MALAEELVETHPHNSGVCPLCEKESVFVELDPWLRDFYVCRGCGSVPRHRALVAALERFAPTWRELRVHESSPSAAIAQFLKRSCPKYSASQYLPDVPRGTRRNGVRSEDLSCLTFPDESLDILVTSDVFEHVLEPDLAFAEIARVLKPGGMHIFTMPWYPENKTTVQRVRKLSPREVKRTGKVIEYLEEPVYHGNPVDDSGSIVTFDWGLDFTDFILRHSGMATTVYLQRDRDRGIDGEFLEVFVSIKHTSTPRSGRRRKPLTKAQLKERAEAKRLAEAKLHLGKSD